MAMMRAAVYRGENQIAVEQVPVPEIGAGEVLVRIACCGVCGTDLKKIHYGLVAPPRIFGHEMAGEIAQVGENVMGWRVGDRVAVTHHVSCLRPDCYYCARHQFARCPLYIKTGTTAGFEPAGGGFAECVRVMDWIVERGMTRMPDDVSFEEASFLEPLNTCLKGLQTAGVTPGDTVLVIGQGPIGLLFTQIARLAGGRVVAVDKIGHRVLLATKLGATIAVNPDNDNLEAAVKGLSEGRGADLAIVAVPTTSVVAQAFDLIRPGGKVLLFANTRLNDPMTVDAGAVCMLEKSLLGSYSSDILLNDETASLIFNRQVRTEELISHRFDLDDIALAVELAANPRGRSLKIMVTM